MRYYTSNYRDTIRKQVKGIQNSIDEPHYSLRISPVQVPRSRKDVKQQCLDAANISGSQISYVKDRIDALYDTLDQFYFDVDRAASSVKGTSKRILELVNEANSALQRINDVLKGVGKYQGQQVSVQNLIDAGISVEKCDQLRTEAWTKIMKEENNLGCIHDQVAINFCNRVVQDIRNNTPLSADDEKLFDPMCSKFSEAIKHGKMCTWVKNLPVVKELYDYYVLNRYGTYDKANSMPITTLQACNDLYETLNPRAAQIMNYFFDNIQSETTPDEEKMNYNINAIKYDL